MRRAFFNVMLRVKSIITTLFSNQKSITFVSASSQYLTVPDSDTLSFGDSSTDSPFSISGWFNLNVGSSTTQGLVTKGTLSQTDIEYRLYLSGDVIRFIIYDASAGNIWIGRYGASVASLKGSWVHIAATYDGSSASSGINIYLNAVKYDTTNINAGTYVAMHNTTNPLLISSLNTTQDWIDGMVDQVVVWDKELSISEVKEVTVLRDLTQHSAYANIVSWWEFDDADVSGTTVSDRVGSNDATMVNTPSRTTCVPFPYSYQLNTTSYFENATPFTDSSTSTLVPYGGFGWDFDGTNEYITIPDGTGLSFTDGAGNDEPFSFSTWISIPNMATQNQIFSKSSGSFEYDCFMVSSQLYIRIYGGGLSNNYLQARVAVSEFPQDKKFLLTITYDGSNTNTGIKIYSNKRLLSTTNSTSGSYLGISNTASPIYIARRSYLSTTMQAYSFAIYNKELSSTEVGEVYNNHEPRDETLSSLSGNLSGYWRGYNSTNTASGVLDQSGNANHGTMTNMEDADIVYRYPREAFDLANGNEGSFDFDGANELITMGDSDDFTFGDGSTTDSPFSVSGWVNADDWTRFRILAKAGSSYEWYFGGTGADAIILQLFDNGVSDYILKGSAASAMTSYEGKWVHVVATYSGSSTLAGIKVYINGTELGSYSTSTAGSYSAMHNTTDNLKIGADDAATYFANGKMAHVSLWNKELSLCEIKEIYNDGSPTDLSQHTAAANLVGWWKMDASDDPTGTVTDASGNGHTGTATNMESGNLLTTNYPHN